MRHANGLGCGGLSLMCLGDMEPSHTGGPDLGRRSDSFGRLLPLYHSGNPYRNVGAATDEAARRVYHALRPIPGVSRL
jgi:hypothetical protein